MILYYILQYTWALALNLAGGVIALCLHLRGEKHFRYHYALATYWNRKSSMALGMFIFLEKNLNEQEPRILYHEYGHTFQSIVLGPLYLPLIALPSAIWANSARLSRYRRRTGRSYYAFYPEKWADRAGLKHTDKPRKERNP